MIRALFTILLCLASAPAVAQAPLDQSLQDVFAEDDRGLRLLRDNGATLGRILTLEQLPSQHYVVEVEVQLADASARYPLKVSRDMGYWRLEWQPDGVYVAALLGMLKNDALPAIDTEDVWTAAARLPAMPVIATRKRFVTPFGEVPIDDRDDDSPPGDLELSSGLVRAGQWWVKKVLDDDPAPAGIDLLLDPQLSWKSTNKLMFNLSTVGLYQVTVVTRGAGALRVATPARPAKFAAVLYPLAEGFGVRIATDDGVVPGDGCAPEMTACVRAPDDLEAVLSGLGTPVAPVMMAASADVATIDVLRFAARFKELVGLGPHQLLVGYVQK